jgi:hypothetical protein
MCSEQTRGLLLHRRLEDRQLDMAGLAVVRALLVGCWAAGAHCERILAQLYIEMCMISHVRVSKSPSMVDHTDILKCDGELNDLFNDGR